MTDTAQASIPVAAAPTAMAPLDRQRQSLQQVVSLSLECAAEEQRVEQAHTEAAAREDTELQKALKAQQQRRARRREELSTGATQRQHAILARFDEQRTSLETAYQATQKQISQTREETESKQKKELEQAVWLSESVLVATEMQADTDDQLAKQDQESRQAELDSLAALEEAVQEALARYGMQTTTVEAQPDEATKKHMATKPREVLEEQRQRAIDVLQQLQAIAKPRVVSGVLPWVLIAISTAVAGAAGFVFPSDPQTKLFTASCCALFMAILGVILFVVFRMQQRARIEAQMEELHLQAMQAVAIARMAAKVDTRPTAAARERHIREARRKRDHEVLAMREQTKAALVAAEEQFRVGLAEESQRYKDQLAQLELEKKRGLEDLGQKREKVSRQIEQEDAKTQQDAQARYAAVLAAIEHDYTRDCQALDARWSQGMRAMTDLLAAGSGIDPRLVDWNSPAWELWQAPADLTGLIRFGQLQVDLSQLTEHTPARLKLPESFSVPAMLSLPAHGSLLVDADHSGRLAAIDLAQMAMARLLTQLPAGGCKFTIFDPVGLGQSFASFMHLADHDESLVGSRIWTEREHMQQRLTDLTEHMETVIQKYLRNEYATIDQYNAQAGELAEPIRYLVIADFPTGFEPETLRRLASIATTGARCGVYTIILRDTRQVLPAGSRMEEVMARSVHLVHKDGAFTWNDPVFKRFPLTVDPAPDEKVLTALMDKVGQAAIKAKRVEVPFESIAPRQDKFWSMSSQYDLRVPIGKSGATRLQALKLGVGVAQHVLVAGKTGSGKSNLMHTIVSNMAMWYGPDEVEFYLVDFKKGVEFKAYATSRLPHARAIAVESDREFGLSVLQRVDAELTRRGTLFRDAGAQEISAFRDKSGQKLPRTVLLIDEFQEFFSEDDKIGQEAAGLLDRLVRQGRAFGVHVILGSQTIGGSSGLARSTLGQIAVRVALQCTEADSQMILGDNNSAARLLTRPGEAVYNDAGGLVEANSPFQIAFLPDEQREKYLDRVRALAESNHVTAPTPIVFEGNSAAAIRANTRLMGLLNRTTYPAAASSIPAYVGEPVAIKEPTAIPFRRQSGANVLMVGQQEESAIAIFASMVASLAAQHKPGEARFYLMDGTPTDSRYFGLLERVLGTIPHEAKVVAWREVPESINEIATIMAERQGNEGHGPAVYLLLFGLQRYRLLRKQEDDFSFSKSDEPAAPKPDKQFAELLQEGPALGLHTIIWADAPVTLERTLDRSSMRQFDHRVLFQMSASDSSNLIDSPLANRLGNHRALLYSEEQGTFEKFRPYEVPDEAWLALLAEKLKGRTI